MCVRYTFHEPEAAVEAVADALGVRLDSGGLLEARYNVAPSQVVPIVAFVTGGPQLWPMRWGLIPPADRAVTKPRIMTNARAETLLKRPAFQAAARRRRCLIPANGFYEFKDMGRRKDPYLFTMADGTPMAIAGVWEPPLGVLPATFCLVTTEPNSDVSSYHNRMPVILTRENASGWLGDQPLTDEILQGLTKPLDAGRLSSRRVNSYVNNSRHEGPKCIAQPDQEAPEPQLGLGLTD
jgi:putative SOS response-associated peptidase YedK